MKNVVLFVSMILIWPLNCVAQSCADWPQWNTFKKHFVSEQGRVIDLGSKQSITTSEGQSYALFFALVANDQTSFVIIKFYFSKLISSRKKVFPSDSFK